LTQERRREPALGRSGRPRRSKSAKGDAEKAPEPLTRQKVEVWALDYVNRFDCTASKLKKHLAERVRKYGGDENAQAWIDELVERYLGSGVLNDARFAKNLATQLTTRGKSSRMISQKLAMRGVPSEVAQELMSARRQDEPNAELDAARAFARKRRLGAHRDLEKRAEYRQKDLAALARQGFSFDTAKKALGTVGGDDDEF
jgi:regulatory protein